MAEKQSLRSINRAPRHAPVPEPKPPLAAPQEVVRDADTGQRTGSVSDRIGVTISPEALAEVRAAFLTDKVHQQDAPPSMTKWVGRAVATHLERTPQSRRARGRAVPRDTGGPKRTYNAPMPAKLRDGLREAVRDELLAGRSISVSGLVREALAVAVEETRDRAGGALVQADGPLPHGR